jgi:hypothetical protein
MRALVRMLAAATAALVSLGAMSENPREGEAVKPELKAFREEIEGR